MVEEKLIEASKKAIECQLQLAEAVRKLDLVKDELRVLSAGEKQSILVPGMGTT